jgi:hypothetical protein
MDARTTLWIIDGLLLLILFVGVPAIAVAIGYAAWKGKPRSFDRQTFLLVSIPVGAFGIFLMVYAQKMQADVRTWQYILQLACFGLGSLLFGVAGGCGVGVLTYRRDALPSGPIK